MPTPSLVLLNARVRTPGDAPPGCTGVAVAGGRIAAVSDDAAVRNLAGPGATVIDCRGHTLVPGLHDAHLHLLALARRAAAVDCSPAAVGGIPALLAALRHAAAGLPPGAWLRAAGYDETALAERRHPTRHDLDAAAPGRPVLLRHRTYHAAVASSAALRLAGVTAASEAPPGGLIGRDAVGEPDGLLFESAQELVRRVMPPPSQDELAAAVRTTSQRLLAWGVTALQDATATNTPADLGLFAALQQRGALAQRVTLMLGAGALPELTERGWAPGHGTAHLALGPLKVVIDESTGPLHPPPDELARLVTAAHRAGFQVALHAVTPEGLDAACDAIAGAQAAHHRPGARHRIEHASVATPAQAARLAGLGVVVCTQPGFLVASGVRYRAEVPPAQQPHLYPLAALAAAGVPLAGGSDAPIASPNPWLGLLGARFRGATRAAPLGAEHALDGAAALALYTTGAATAVFREGALGRIAPGYRADLALLDCDPVTAAPDALAAAAALLTVIDGAVAYRAR